MVVEATVNPKLIGVFKDDFANSNWSLKDGQDSPDGKWYCRYAGYGAVKSATYDGTKVMMLEPALPSTSDGTRACSISTRQKFKNFDMTFKMRTIKQTRPNGNNWEVAWIFFRQTDQSHHYYMYIQKNGGIEIGRKDMIVWEEKQIFLKTTPDNSPSFVMDKWQTVRIKMVGFHLEVWLDGIKYVDIVDDGTFGNDGGNLPKPPSDQMKEGFIGPYCEDAQVCYDRFVITPLP